MFLIDTNVLLDIATADPTWLAWSQNQLGTVLQFGPVLVNQIIYAELAPAFKNQSELDAWLNPQFFRRSNLPFLAGWLAANAFTKYRQSGGSKQSPLPDFYIGAHAEYSGLTLVTRDSSRYRTYFPAIKMICP